jgi:RND family efflux transporter MFP subunit
MKLMRSGRFQNNSSVARWLAWAALTAVLLCAAVLILPGFIHMKEADVTRVVVAEETDPAWASAARKVVDTRPDGADASGVSTGESGTAESVREIDDSWLAPEDAQADENDSVSLACIIEPFEVVKIGSAVTGLIEAIHVERSDFVADGQVLVEIESGAELAAVRLARSRADMDEEIRSREASAKLSERRRVRVAQLYSEESLSLDLREEIDTEAEVARFELEQAQAEKKLASHQLDQAVSLLTRRTIRSPISGVVVERLMSPGERVDEEVILTVAQIDPLGVEVILPASAFGSVEVGMRVAIVPEFPGDTVHVAAVTIVDRVIDSASGTFGVRLELPNPDHAIPGGVHCQIQFLDE